MALNGLILDRRENFAKDWRNILVEILNDGILNNSCKVTFTSNSITVGDGYFILKGAVVNNKGAETIPITPTLTNGYVRLKCRIDLTKEASETGPGQVSWETEFSATTTFPALTQEDINGTGSVYEGEIAVLQIVNGNITALTRSMGPAEIDAERINGHYENALNVANSAKLGNQPAAYYAPLASPNFTGRPAAPEFGTNKNDGSFWFKGDNYWMRLHYSGSTFYFHKYNAGGTSVVGSPLTIDGAGKVTVNGTLLGLGNFEIQGITAHGMIKVNNGMGIDQETGNVLKLVANGGVNVKNSSNAFTIISASHFNTGSSVRFKDIHGAMIVAQARKILNLDFIKFTYKAEYDDGGKIHYGIKAEQADELGLEDIVAYDAEGLPCGIDYSKLTPYLGVIAQDHNERIAKLEDENAVLKKQIAAFEKRLEALEAK